MNHNPGNETRKAGSRADEDDARAAAIWAAIERQAGMGGGVRWHPRRETCPSCRRLVVRGLDSHIAAAEVRLDLVPLSPLGEAVVLAAGGYTWSLWWRGAHPEIVFRFPDRIRACPAGSIDRGDVLARHACLPADVPPWPPPGPLRARSNLPGRQRAGGDIGDPPF